MYWTKQQQQQIFTYIKKNTMKRTTKKYRRECADNGNTNQSQRRDTHTHRDTKNVKKSERDANTERDCKKESRWVKKKMEPVNPVVVLAIILHENEK